MKWQTFQGFAASHLNLGTCLSWHIGPPYLRGNKLRPDPALREWIEKWLKYVAVRPFDALDLSAIDYGRGPTTVHFAVWHHIEGNEQPFSRLRYIDSDGADTSIGQAIDSLVEWHGLYWALQENRPLALDAVVRVLEAQVTGTDHSHQSVEIFLVPDEYQPAIWQRPYVAARSA